MNDAVASPEAMRPTRTDAFRQRLEKRYAAERRFKLAGLSAVLISVAVLIFLLGNMTFNGVAGFQRAELDVTVDLSQSGIAGDASTLTGPTAIQVLEGQGLADVVQFYAEQELGEEGASGVSSDAWREVAADIIADPSILQTEQTFSLPTSDDLASGLKDEGSAEMQALADQLEAEGKPVSYTHLTLPTILLV